MIYGLYLSATGVLTNSHRQDVIANNLANTETVGFKRDLALFQERRTEARERGVDPGSWSNPLLEDLGGGTFASPTVVDNTQGDMESTGNPTDLAIQGEGFFAVLDKGQLRLTRNGQFMVDRQNRLVLAGSAQPVLDTGRRPIALDGTGPVTIEADGTVTQAGKAVGQVGLFRVADPTRLGKRGSAMLAYPDPKGLKPSDATLRPGFVERSNVDPTIELTSLLDAQRQLEANANMIRIQDQMLSRLVNDVGKIG
jgi:flagellar basal-body rod protein FlgF